MADAADTVTVTLTFSSAEYDLLQQAGKGHAPDDWMRGVLIDVACVALQEPSSDDEEPGGYDDAEAPQEPLRAAQGADGSEGPLLVAGETAALLERLDGLVQVNEEALAWVRSIYAELCAHTEFPSEKMATACRAKAERQFFEKQRQIDDWMRRKRAH